VNSTIIFRSGAALTAFGIIAGAFGAHGLEGKVSPERLETFEIAVRYQMYSALGLIAVAGYFQTIPRLTKPLTTAFYAVLIGTLIFSGTLYGIVGGGPKWLGAITPIGGTLQIVGWLIFAAKAGKRELVD
jgi:uncharacterized membrane protein YgdD (TMEM256/DUF423 family)